MSLYRIGAAALTAILTVGLAACASSPEPVGSSETTTDAPVELETVRFTVFPGAAASMGVYVADTMGFFEEQGLEVEYVNTGTGSSALQLLAAGGTDFTITDLTGAANANTAGGDVKMVSGQFKYFSGAIICQPDIDASGNSYPESMETLVGRSIGITAPGSTTDVYTRYSLIEAGFDPAGVEIVPIGGLPQLMAAFQAKSIDCITAYQPMQQLIEDSTMIVNWEAGEGPAAIAGDYLQNGIATTGAYAQSNPEIVERVALAMKAATDFASESSNAADIAHATIQFFEGQDIETLTSIVRDISGTYTYTVTESQYDNAAGVYQTVTGDDFPSTYEALVAESAMSVVGGS